MIIKIVVGACLATALLFPIACGRSPAGATLRTNARDSDTEIEVSVWDSHITEPQQLSWMVSESKLRNRAALHSINFIDGKHGWAGGFGASLYQTDDGGATWKPIQVDGVSDLNVQSIILLNSLVGWIVLQKDSPVPMESDSYLRLIETSDGGRTWVVRYEGKGISATQLAFIDDRNGWLTGLDYRKSPFTHQLILHTADRGEDASAELKRMLAEHPQPNEGIMGVAFRKSTGATMITTELRMFQTTDEGKSWERIGSIKNSYGQDSVVRRFGVIDGKFLWSIGGSSSPIRGTRGLLFTEQQHS